MTDVIKDVFEDVLGYVNRLFTSYRADLLTLIHQPTPLKFTFNITADTNGIIGGGFANPNPVLLWQSSMAHETWINRITITSPSGTPKAPLTTGQLMCTAGSGEPI